MAQKIIVGNWKMNPATLTEAKNLFSGIQRALSKIKNVQAVLCPPFPYIPAASELLKASKAKTSFVLGAQNIFFEPKGAFTGEVSAELLSQFGVKYVIIGHSERRKRGETDEEVNKKVLAALRVGLKPIICIGEHIRDEEGQYLSVIKAQIEKAVAGVSKKGIDSTIIAYEPIWAIGATAAMNPHDVHEMSIYIKKCLVEIYKVRTIVTPVLYGGSVDPQNAFGIIHEGGVQGLLIGRQSLELESLTEILKTAQSS
jgi:triosephosphate isomerase